MNINDVEAPEDGGTKKLELIFERQQELMEKYHHIEAASGTGWGLLSDKGFHIDDQRSQELCKNFAWRITEELAECIEALIDHPENIQHYQEEAIDALHFLVALMLINEISPKKIRHCELNKLESLFSELSVVAKNSPEEYGFGVILELGKAMNCLKQKPWKQTHVLTDIDRYKGLLRRTFYTWILFANRIGLTAQSTYDIYSKKAEVNKFRQRSNY